VNTTTVGDVPVDAFWSISMCNAHGFFEPSERGACSINSVTAQREPDGSVAVRLGARDDEQPNCLQVMNGWNYPRAAVSPTRRDPRWVPGIVAAPVAKPASSLEPRGSRGAAD
jgi:hypothetical protein